MGRNLEFNSKRTALGVTKKQHMAHTIVANEMYEDKSIDLLNYVVSHKNQRKNIISRLLKRNRETERDRDRERAT